VTRVAERALAIGNRRGTERRGSFAVAALKGGRLDAVVRFQFMANEPDAVDAAVEELHKRLLADRDKLWAAGFLRVGCRGNVAGGTGLPPPGARPPTTRCCTSSITMTLKTQRA
jgi:hypothetical protein